MAASVIGALRVNLGLDSAQFNRGAKNAQTTAQRLGRQMQKIGAAASAVGAGVALAIRGQLNAADQLGKSAQQLGLPVEALSQLQHAASMSGVSISSLETVLRRLSQNMAQDADKFAALGIAVRDVNGEMRPTADVMAEVAEVLAGMPDGAEKTALAMDLMGRSGAEMIPMLNGGRDALREMMEEADRLGLTISQDTANAAAEFNDNLQRLGGQMRGLVRIITAQLAPVLEKISNAVVKVAERFQGMSPEMQRFAAIAAALAVAIGPVLIAVGSLVLIIGAISAPVLLAVAGIAALTAGFVAFWTEIVAAKDAVVDFIRDGLERASDALEEAQDAVRAFKDRMIDLGTQGVEFVKQKLRELVAFLADLPAQFREAGANLMAGLAEGVRSGAASARDAVGNAARGVWDTATGFFRTQSPSLLFHEMGEDLMQGLANGITANGQAPIKAMEGVASQLSGPVSEAAQTVQNAFQNAFTAIITGSQSASDAISNLLSQLASMLANQAFQMLFGAAFGGGVGAPLNVMGSGPLASFDGGGFTGHGSRTGGLDGRGGFPAILHPNETVIDHTRAGGRQEVHVVVDLKSEMLEAQVVNTSRAVVRTETPRMIGNALRSARENRSLR